MNKYCKICFDEIKVSPIRNLVENNPLICDSCLKKIQIDINFKKIDNVLTLFLANYNSLFKNLLKNYKEYRDIELAPCFLFPFLPIIKILFKNYIFIPCPSSKENENKRGFNHLEEILKANNLTYKLCLEKTTNDEQKNLNLISRFQKNTIKVINGQEKYIIGKKIIVFDDVCTTGSTLKNSFDAIKKYPLKSIKGLVILNNHKENELKIK